MFNYIEFQNEISKRQRNMTPQANKITAFLLRLIHKLYAHNIFFNGR